MSGARIDRRAAALVTLEFLPDAIVPAGTGGGGTGRFGSGP